MGPAPAFLPIVSTEEELLGKLHQRLKGEEYSALSLLYTDINSLGAWYDAYGVEVREVAIFAHFRALVLMEENVRRRYDTYRLKRVARHKWDKFLLADTGDVDDVSDIARMLRDALNITKIPGAEQRVGKRTIERGGQKIELNPEYLTVRIGAAYQSREPFDREGLLERAIRAAKEAKQVEGQIVVVEYTP